MNIQEIYKLAIEMGIKNDFRKKEQIAKSLKRQKEKYEKLSKEEKEIFDNIPDKEEMLLRLFKFHLLSVYTYLFNNSVDNSNKEKGIKSLYQIFFLSGRYLFIKNGEDIDMLFHKMIAYYNSFKINNFELRREIEANNIENAITIEINQEESIRIISNLNRLELIPTNKTRTIFKYLL